MLNIMIETKNEYTTHLINILTPLIFEGLRSVYKQSLEVSKNDDVLKIFQSFLKAIPKWNQSLIDKESNRIINSSQSYGWLNDLIKATLKSNLIILMYNPTNKIQNKVNQSLYKNIKTSDFIHKIYIECAREIWNNPYLFFHNYPPIEIKRNQRDCMCIIKDCIKEALRKLLPVKHILEFYLGDDYEDDKNKDQFEKALTDVEERNLTKIIKKDLTENLTMSKHKQKNTELSTIQKNTEKSVQKNNETSTNNFIKESQLKKHTNGVNTNEPILLKQSLNNERSNEQTLGSAILEVINKTELHKLDNKIINVLQDDFQTSIAFSHDNNEKYQDVFSNNKLNVKNKLFDNYLEFDK
jgi:hypothetical protein